jgi:radical SAM protein (TIGR01212 family)
MQGGERYYSINEYLRNEFGQKTVKLSLDAGFTCPNRDGRIGYGGCAFCSVMGSGDKASDISSQIELLAGKWPGAKYLAYFQSFTNTYAPVDVLRKTYYKALDDDRISGIAIATRPDCLGDDVLALLDEINRDHFMWVELGLQTSNDEVSRAMGTGHTSQDFVDSVSKLNALGIKTVAHILLGLPGETREDMFRTVRFACNQGIFGLKLHMLNVIKGTRLYETMPDYKPFKSIDEYTDLVVDLLTVIPPDVTIHRLTADVPRPVLVSPSWSYKKRTILNTINKKLADRDLRQGCKLE